jgi:hypothetical protein
MEHDGPAWIDGFKIVLGAAFCAVAAVRLTCIVLSLPCPESIQWMAASAGAASLAVHLVVKAARRRRLA